jgi:hypothetical protein
MAILLDWIQVVSLYSLAVLGVGTLWRHIYHSLMIHLIYWSYWFPSFQNWLTVRYRKEYLQEYLKTFGDFKKIMLLHIDEIQDENVKQKTKEFLAKLENLFQTSHENLEEVKLKMKKITDEFYELMKNYYR